MSFSEMETFLERHIEGFFNRKFASDLQFAEIQKSITHIINRNRKKVNDAFFVPNYYEIIMSNADYARICSRKSREMLREYIIRSVISENLFIDAELIINFIKNGKLKKGTCDVKAAYKNSDDMLKSDDITEKTIIIQKPGIQNVASVLTDSFYATLTVTSGKDMDSQLDIGEQQIHIGRREENEFLLTDPNISRLHAYIAFEKYRHILYDAGSLNGTFVNGKRISVVCLQDKDVIDMGETTIVYEVRR